MRVSLALGERRPLDRTTAWGCLTANLAMPGTGTLVAGRRRGYLQGALALVGMALSLVFGLRYIAWQLANYARLQDEMLDPLAVAGEVWMAARWALLGIALFALAWLWGLGSGLSFLREARRTDARPKPPAL